MVPKEGASPAPRLPRETWVALDMAGCPNRCRHCYLGYPPTRRVGGEELAHLVERFRAWGRPGEAFHIEGLRPTVADLGRLPAELLEESVAHLGRPLGEAESDIVARLCRSDETAMTRWSWPERLGFYVTSRLDVFANIGVLNPWWRLGNLAGDDVGDIVERLEGDGTIGLRVLRDVPLSVLARRFGRPRGRRLYTEGDLIARWVLMECRRRWAERPHAADEGREKP